MPCQNCKEESVIYLIYMIFCCCLFFLQSFLLCLFFSKTVLSWPWFTSVLIAEIKISPKLFCHFPSLSTTQQRRPSSGEAFVLFTTIVAALLLRRFLTFFMETTRVSCRIHFTMYSKFISFYVRISPLFLYIRDSIFSR